MTTQPNLTPRPTACGFSTNLALLVLRLALAWIFIYHGGGKVFGWFDGPGVEKFSHYLQGMPLLPPIVWAWMAALGEFLGGLSMLLGLLTRLGTIPIMIVMFVAVATVHAKNGFSGYSTPILDSATQKVLGMQLHPGYEYNMAIVALALAVLLAGPGLISLDALLFPRGCCPSAPRPLANPQK